MSAHLPISHRLASHHHHCISSLVCVCVSEDERAKAGERLDLVPSSANHLSANVQLFSGRQPGKQVKLIGQRNPIDGKRTCFCSVPPAQVSGQSAAFFSQRQLFHTLRRLEEMQPEGWVSGQGGQQLLTVQPTTGALSIASGSHSAQSRRASNYRSLVQSSRATMLPGKIQCSQFSVQGWPLCQWIQCRSLGYLLIGITQFVTWSRRFASHRIQCQSILAAGCC